MALIKIAKSGELIHQFDQMTAFLQQHGILLEQWRPIGQFKTSALDEDIFKAYEHKIGPYMLKNSLTSKDVINVDPATAGIEDIRQKFLQEHTHSEDEIRFFIDGQGLFWFNHQGQVFSILCTAGDFLSVPAGHKHWFDLAPAYHVKAIRLFTSQDGWKANYTKSGIEQSYNPR